MVTSLYADPQIYKLQKAPLSAPLYIKNMHLD